MTSINMFGIKNCDTVKRAKSWLDDHGKTYCFHDYAKLGIDEPTLRAWVDELGWEVLLNKAGTTFRGLANADKQEIDKHKAIALMLSNPSMIKRPVLDLGERRIVGFKPHMYEVAFNEL